MVRTILTPQAAPGAYASTFPALTFAALDFTNGIQVVGSGKDLIIVRNPTAGSLNFTMKSALDPFGRTGDIVKAIPANGLIMVGPLEATGWRQTTGRLWMDASATGLEIAVIRLP